jgi:ribosomal-protein-alanine N-acetyltransferase
MQDLLIREAGDADRDWAAALLAGSEPWITLGVTLEQCLNICHDSRYEVFISLLDNQPCGVMITDPRGLASSPYIKSVAVAESYRNRKVGAALLDYVEKWYRTRSAHLFLCVSSFNTDARRFYEKHGFRQVGELSDYIIPGASELILHKSL